MRIATLTAASLLLIAAPASAAQRFASPTGAGNCSSVAQACSLTTALESANNNDEVIVLTGEYTVTSDIDVNATNLDVHGDTSEEMPVIEGTAASLLTLNFIGAGSDIYYLAVSHAGATGAAIGAVAARISRVDVAVDNDTGITVLADSQIRDSLVTAGGTNAVALYLNGPIGGGTGTALVRNVTAIADGTNATAVQARASSLLGANVTLNAKNLIADAPNGTDIKSFNDGGFVTNLNVTNSNFDSYDLVGGTIALSNNQDEPPLFVDADNGDFREAPGSPTIDAGLIDQVGPLDLAGNLRTHGNTVDIGAYEFIPGPAPSPTPPPNLTPAPGAIQSLTTSPNKFRAAASGASIAAKRKSTAKIGTTVTYSMSAAGPATFTVERATKGRKSGKSCKKQTRKNRTKRSCTIYTKLKGSLSHTGRAGANTFKFSGRLDGKKLKPGAYRLTGTTGKTTRQTNFKIVR